MALLVCTAPVGPAGANDAATQACIDQLGDPDVDIIACEIPFALESRAKEDLMRITGGVVRDAGCLLEIGLDRISVFEALISAENLTVPAQPVQCDVETDRRPMRAQFTLAPKVWFADGRAVGATPGMGNVTGVSPLLAMLLSNWVNNHPQVRRAMVAWVNDYIENGVR